MFKLFVLCYLLLKTILLVRIYQQAHYQIKAYLKHYAINSFFYGILADLAMIISLLVHNDAVYILTGSYLLISGSFFLFAKQKLCFTKRIIRLLSVIMLSVIGAYFLPLHSLVLYAILYEFALVPILLLMSFFEEINNHRYIRKTSERLRSYKGNRIAITGSFGKTSTKFFLANLLEIIEPTAYSQKSYNTPLGISRFVSNTTIEAYHNLIFEFGASKPKDIQKLVNIVKPNVGIITEIGPMHLDGFHTIKAIVKEKCKLIDSLPKMGIGIYNAENEYLRNYHFQTEATIYSYGYRYGYVQARNISMNQSFDLYINNCFIMPIKVGFYGEHNILNLLAGITYLFHRKADLSRFLPVIYQLKNIDNRLNIVKEQQHIIIDDAFNANIVGLKNSISMMLDFQLPSFIITPGIVEMGELRYSIEAQIADYLSKIDTVILVGFRQTRRIGRNLKRKGKKAYVVSSFKQAYGLYHKLRGDKSVLLIENDLPDLYREGFEW